MLGATPGRGSSMCFGVGGGRYAADRLQAPALRVPSAAVPAAAVVAWWALGLRLCRLTPTQVCYCACIRATLPLGACWEAGPVELHLVATEQHSSLPLHEARALFIEPLRPNQGACNTTLRCPMPMTLLGVWCRCTQHPRVSSTGMHLKVVTTLQPEYINWRRGCRPDSQQHDHAPSAAPGTRLACSTQRARRTAQCHVDTVGGDAEPYIECHHHSMHV